MKQRNIIPIQNIAFVELTPEEVRNLYYRQIMFIHKAKLGAMGYSGYTFFLLKKGKEIKGYFCKGIDFGTDAKCKGICMQHCEDFLPICYVHLSANATKYWKKINMGAGNSLFLRQKFVEEFQRRAHQAKCYKIPYLYGKWVDIALQIIKGKNNEI